MTIVEQPWPTGVPCWVDCQVDDVPAAVDFYRAVFGWEIEQERLTGEGHEFHIAWQDGRPVAGIGPKATGDVVPPSGWLTYFSCTDVDRAVAATTRLGGTVFYDPVDLVDACRLCCAVDPKGTAFGLWEARRSPGYRSMGGVGTVVWHELHTRRFCTQHDFYAAVLDLDWTSDGGGDESYVSGTVGGSEVVGVVPEALIPPSVPSHWAVWFGVEDLPAWLERATAAGAVVARPPHGSQSPAQALMRGPQGEEFGVIEVTGEEVVTPADLARSA